MSCFGIQWNLRLKFWGFMGIHRDTLYVQTQIFVGLVVLLIFRHHITVFLDTDYAPGSTPKCGIQFSWD